MNNNILKFYPLYETSEACRDYLGGVPQANKEGFFEQDGEICRTISDWAKLFGITSHMVRNRLEKAGVSSIKGKSNQGRIVWFFTESAARSSCMNLPDIAGQFNDDETLEMQGVSYGSADYFAVRFGISMQHVLRIAGDSNVTKLFARTQKGTVKKAFLVSEMEQLSSKLLSKRKKK